LFTIENIKRKWLEFYDLTLRYPLPQSLDRFTRLSAMPIAENPFQIQFAEGLQFWLDARFIVLRHDLKRIQGVQAVVGGMALAVVAVSAVVFFEPLTGIGTHTHCQCQT
jgi:hypothetical protein